jgi:hypothetical protein
MLISVKTLLKRGRYITIKNEKVILMLDETELVFISTTGRSGTKYLANIINKNAINATAEHDPYPRGYGEPIKWYDSGEKEKLIRFAKTKMKRLNRGKKFNGLLDAPLINDCLGRGHSNSKKYLPFKMTLRNYFPSVKIKDIYVESTHAFIKSFGESMYNLRPDISLIHLTRDPLEVAKSFFNRGTIPGPDNPFLLDPNFKKNKIKIPFDISDFQKCLWYWFETESRHYDFIEEHHIEKIIDIDTTSLNNPIKIKEMFRELDIRHKNDIILDVGRNKNKKPTKLNEEDINEARELIEKIPAWVFERIGDKFEIQNKLEVI